MLPHVESQTKLLRLHDTEAKFTNETGGLVHYMKI